MMKNLSVILHICIYSDSNNCPNVWDILNVCCMTSRQVVRVPIFPIVVCVRSAYVIGAGVGFRVESGAVALLQLDL